MSALPLQRIRLETDALLRDRAFFSRAVRGILQPLHYMDLVGQLAALTLGAGREHAAPLLLAAGEDLRQLRGHSSESLAPGPCEAVSLYHTLFESERVGLPLDLTLQVGLAVLGTSWCSDASHSLTRRYPQATRLLERVSAQGARSLLAVSHHVHAHRAQADTVYALAELTRGALLGLATYLDTTWRAPSASFPVPASPSGWS